MKEHFKRRTRRLAACGIALAVALPLAGCGAGTAQQGADSAPIKIAVIGQSEGIQFWDLVKQGAVEAGEELAYDVTYANAESITDIDGQIRLVNEAIANDVDVIVIAPNDPKKINEALRDAVEKDISVLTIDADVTYDQRLAYIGTDNTNGGSIAGKRAYDYLLEHQVNGEMGKIGIIAHSESATASVERVEGFKSAILSKMGVATQGGPPAGVGGNAQGGPPAGVGGNAQGGPPAGVGEDANAQGGPPAGVGEDANAQGGPPAGAGEDANAQGGPPAGAGEDTDVQGGPPAGVGEDAGVQGGPPAGVGGASASAEDLVVDVRYCNSDADAAKELALEMISEHPDIQLIFTTNERSTLGVCEAVESEEMKNLIGDDRVISVFGFNSNDSEINYLKSGTLTGTVVQNPYNMGYLGVYYGGQAAKGNSVAKTVDTGVTFVSNDNLNRDEIQLLLDPAAYTKKKEGNGNG